MASPHSTPSHRNRASSSFISSSPSNLSISYSSPPPRTWVPPASSTPARAGSSAAVQGGGGIGGLYESTYGRGGGGTGESTTRQSNTTVFEWRVSNVRALELEVATLDEETEPVNELLRPGPVIGNGTWKIDIQAEYPPSPSPEPLATPSFATPVRGIPSSAATTPFAAQDEGRSLWLYIASLAISTDYGGGGGSDGDVPASILIGVKSVDEDLGLLHAPIRWVWHQWEQDFSFGVDTEFWKCPLPPISTLLLDPSIQSTDAFTLVLQISTPFPQQPPSLPEMHYAPKDLLKAFELCLDNAETGDVKFICRERSPFPPPSNGTTSLAADADLTSSILSTPSTSNTSSTASTMTNFMSSALSRKRIIWAHSTILRARSAYFEALFAGGWSESTKVDLGGGRKAFVVDLSDGSADFATLYWTLRWIYTNALQFNRNATNTRLLHRLSTLKPVPSSSSSLRDGVSATSEFDWQPIYSSTSRTHSVSASASTVSSSGPRSRSSDGPLNSGRIGGGGTMDEHLRSPVRVQQQQPQHGGVKSGAKGRSGAPAVGSPISRGAVPLPFSPHQSTTTPRPSSIYTPPSRSSIPVPSTYLRSPPSSAGRRIPPKHSRPLSPPSLPPPSHQHRPDPHPHPTPPPPPSTPLQIYALSSLYLLPALSHLAQLQLLSSLTPSSAIPTLLACSLYSDLHAKVEDYVVGVWEEIVRGEEIERCTEEVARGDWEDDGGRVLMSLLRRMSPSGRER